MNLIQRSALIATGLAGLLLLPVLAQQKTPASKTDAKPADAKTAKTADAKTADAKAPGKQAPAAEPALKRVGPGKMEVGDGKAAVKWSPTAEALAGKTTTFPKGKKTQLALQDAIAMGSASKAAVKVGGSTLRLLDSVTFAIRKVGAETSVVTVLDVDLEVERGTVLELEYGSVRVVVITGSCTMRPSTQPVSNENLPGAWGDSSPRKTVQTNRVEVTSPGSNSVMSATLVGAQQLSVVRTASGNLTISVPPGAAPVTFTIVTTDPATGETTTTTKTVKPGDPPLSSSGGGVVKAKPRSTPSIGENGGKTGTPDGTTSQSKPITGGNR